MGSSLDTTIALVSSTDMASYLGMSSASTAEIAELDLLNNAASQLALTWTGRTTLISKALTEYYPGDNSMMLLTYSYPISSVTQVWIDVTGQFTSGVGTIVDSSNYQVIERGKIVLIGGAFLQGVGDCDSIKLTYTAGYGTTPHDLQMACKELVQYWYYRELDKRVGLTANTAGNTTKSYETDIPRTVRTVYDRYRNFARRVL